MISVTCDLPIYEVNDRDTSVDIPRLIVKSHWNDSRRVVLQLANGERITVIAADLKAAIDNATNTRKF